MVFFICWAPFHTQRLLVIYLKGDDWTPAMTLVQNVLYYISGVLYYVSAVVNPILYNIMSLKFRQAFRNTIFRPFCRCCFSSKWSKRSSLQGMRVQQKDCQQLKQQHQLTRRHSGRRRHQTNVYRFTTRKPYTESNITLTAAAARKQLNNISLPIGQPVGSLVTSNNQLQQAARNALLTKNGGSRSHSHSHSGSTSHSDNLHVDLDLALAPPIEGIGGHQRRCHSYHYTCKSSVFSVPVGQQTRKYHSFA